ncbi:AMP-binding protein, partial [Streptomyces sp. MCAF7]
AMPVPVLAELRRRLPDLALYNFYGQTEMSPIATVLGPADQERKAGSAGRPGLHVETRLVDERDRPVAPGTVGEIVHRGPHVTPGYWQDPERTAEAFRGGWFHSGDLGVFDEEGHLTIVDRKKDMVNSGGENVSGREVEEVVHA